MTMKKAQLFFVLFCFILSLSACRPGGEQEKNVSGESGSSLTVGEELPAEDVTSLEDVAGAEIPMGSGQESEEPQGEESEDSPGTAVPGNGKYGPKTGKFVKIMESGKYRLQFDVVFPEEDLSIETAYDMAVNQGMFYMQIKTDNSGDDPLLPAVNLKTIFRGGKIYLLNDQYKTYVETPGGMLEAGAVDTAGLKFVESGKEGSLDYEEYSSAGGSTLRYYTQGGNLVKFSSASEIVRLEGENVRLTQDVPDGLFEIPSGYKKMAE